MKTRSYRRPKKPAQNPAEPQNRVAPTKATGKTSGKKTLKKNEKKTLPTSNAATNGKRKAVDTTEAIDASVVKRAKRDSTANGRNQRQTERDKKKAMASAQQARESRARNRNRADPPASIRRRRRRPARGPAVQAVLPAAVQVVFPADLPADLPAAVQAAVQAAILAAVPDAVLDAIPVAVQAAVLGAVQAAVQTAILGAVPGAVPDAVTAAIPVAAQAAVLGTVPDNVRVDDPADVSDTVPDTVSDSVLNTVTNTVTNSVPDAVTDAVPVLSEAVAQYPDASSNDATATKETEDSLSGSKESAAGPSTSLQDKEDKKSRVLKAEADGNLDSDLTHSASSSPAKDGNQQDPFDLPNYPPSPLAHTSGVVSNGAQSPAPTFLSHEGNQYEKSAEELSRGSEDVDVIERQESNLNMSGQLVREPAIISERNSISEDHQIETDTHTKLSEHLNLPETSGAERSLDQDQTDPILISSKEYRQNADSVTMDSLQMPSQLDNVQATSGILKSDSAFGPHQTGAIAIGWPESRQNDDPAREDNLPMPSQIGKRESAAISVTGRSTSPAYSTDNLVKIETHSMTSQLAMTPSTSGTSGAGRSLDQEPADEISINRAEYHQNADSLRIDNFPMPSQIGTTEPGVSPVTLGHQKEALMPQTSEIQHPPAPQSTLDGTLSNILPNDTHSHHFYNGLPMNYPQLGGASGQVQHLPHQMFGLFPAPSYRQYAGSARMDNISMRSQIGTTEPGSSAVIQGHQNGALMPQTSANQHLPAPQPTLDPISTQFLPNEAQSLHFHNGWPIHYPIHYPPLGGALGQGQHLPRQMPRAYPTLPWDDFTGQGSSNQFGENPQNPMPYQLVDRGISGQQDNNWTEINHLFGVADDQFAFCDEQFQYQFAAYNQSFANFNVDQIMHELPVSVASIQPPPAMPELNAEDYAKDGPAIWIKREGIIIDDVLKLEESHFINDKIIANMGDLLIEKVKNEEKERMIIMDSLFFACILEKKPEYLDANIALDYNTRNKLSETTNKWFKTENLFDKKVLLFPINADNHWMLTVVLNPRGAIIEEEDPTNHPPCRIFFMDPMGSIIQYRIENMRELIRTFLRAHFEAVMNLGGRTRKGTKFAPTAQFAPDRVQIATMKNLPVQENMFDCGAYVVHFMDGILDWKDGFSNLPAHVDPDWESWHPSSNYTLDMMREKILNSLIDLSTEEKRSRFSGWKRANSFETGKRHRRCQSAEEIKKRRHKEYRPRCITPVVFHFDTHPSKFPSFKRNPREFVELEDTKTVRRRSDVHKRCNVIYH
ncbi:hypothetical protein CRE_07656 [Caenorhabditis remanei]|uniref:Ubiquitin-like protease family profile domain-containing protein n=1 Tax=Caenorhabditis remanei TaxID=31234 RepID=E3MP45_CAERE|nr:hypothetical protein CRE_07656 [Caenorhabditis remanei]